MWQILPLLPTGYGDSPYQSVCSYALNYYLIDLAMLAEKGLFTEAELAKYAQENGYGQENSRIDYEKLFHTRVPFLKKAFARFVSRRVSRGASSGSGKLRSVFKGGRIFRFRAFHVAQNAFFVPPVAGMGRIR